MLQSMVSQRLGHELASEHHHRHYITNTHTYPPQVNQTTSCQKKLYL